MVSEQSLGLLRRLGRQAVRCPGCQQVWLAPGLAGGEQYACKACGAIFFKKCGEVSPPPRDLSRPLPRQGMG